MVQLLHDDRHTAAYMVGAYMRVSCWWVSITSNQSMTCCTPADGRVIVRHIWHGSVHAAMHRIATWCRCYTTANVPHATRVHRVGGMSPVPALQPRVVVTCDNVHCYHDTRICYMRRTTTRHTDGTLNAGCVFGESYTVQLI